MANHLKKRKFFFVFPIMIMSLSLFYSSCMEADNTNSQLMIPSEAETGIHLSNVATRIDNAFDKINDDQQQGIITHLEAIELRGLYFLAPEQLPPRYQFEHIKIIKCATPYILDIHHNWALLSPDAQQLFKRTLARPEMQHYYDTPGGHCRIHYDTSGDNEVYQSTVDEDGDGHPDFVNVVAQAVDFSWVEEATPNGVHGLDFDPPPDDGTAGGNGRYDFYMYKVKGAYGVTEPEGDTDQYPGRNAVKSYITIDPRFASSTYQERVDRMRTTVAHEFFHAIQMIYNNDSWTEGTYWFWEAGAMWMEDMVYDDINDYYGYLTPRFNKPYKPLNEFDYGGSTIHYGACIWYHFLQQYHQDNLIAKNMWEAMINTTSSYNALDSVLASTYNSDLRTDFQIYTQWNYICGKNDDGQHYEEGAAWASSMNNREVWIAHEYSSTSYPVSSDQPEKAPEPMGCDYIRFNVNSSKPGLSITFDGADSNQWGASIVVAHTDGTTSETRLSLNNEYQGAYEVSDLSRVQSVILIPQNLKLTGSTGAAFHYEADYLSNLAAPTGLTAYSTIYSSFAGAKQYVYLTWDQNTESELSGYNLYRTEQSGTGYTQVNSSLLSATNYLDEGLDPATVYYYIVKAVESSGRESAASNEAHS
ncbi:MXAN_6640 family putative metalloprotease [candidate division CSSED10-310 bacterium]|uniref:MXAN_6640 family putative metalloprotease n=1 Tax=candidate division CSSED10-310 bacterium TaxID=2855610 RepID=A0ABV6YRG7_UNCC1